MFDVDTGVVVRLIGFADEDGDDDAEEDAEEDGEDDAEEDGEDDAQDDDGEEDGEDDAEEDAVSVETQFSPEGIAYRAAGSPESERPPILYVADATNECIRAFHADTGRHLRVIGADELSNPCGVAVQEAPESSGQPTLLAVADYFSNRVLVFDADTGDLLHTIGDGTDGSALGELNYPAGVTLHPGANGATLLFVTERGNNRVQMFVL